MSIILYRIFIFLYACGIEIATVFNRKARLWYRGRIKIFKKLQKAFKGNKAPVIWFHCASLGEFEQGRPLLEKLKLEYPDHKILLTFFSPSGYEIHKTYALADHVFYLPLDGESHAKKFLSITKPRLVIFVKYEFWYFYLKNIHQRNIPLLLVSAIFRENQPFFKWYGGLHRKMLSFFTRIFIQNATSQKLLQSINVNNTTVCGDTRVDRVLQIEQNWKPVEKIAEFCGEKQVLVAGSTWLEDDDVLNHFVNKNQDIRFLIAPHEIDDGRIKECLEMYKHVQLYSDYLQNGPQPDCNVLIINNIGTLNRLYKYATICYVGGGFGDDGIHNVLEAAVYHKPVIFGPVYEKFLEAVELEEYGAAFPVDNVLELEDMLHDLLQDQDFYREACKASAQYVQSKAGATQQILQYIQKKILN